MSLAQHIDLAPTSASYLGAPKALAWQGRDLLDGRLAAPAVAHIEEDHEGNVLSAVRGGAPGQSYKSIVANADSPRALPTHVVFDLRADPGEATPVEGAQAQRITDDLASFLRLQDEAQRSLAPERGPQGVRERDKKLSVDDEAQLRALGYVE